MNERGKRTEVERYVDAGFIPPDNWTATAVIQAELRRIRSLALAAAYAAEFPRRLGPDADGGELAADKNLSKGITHTYWGLWKRIVGSVMDPEDLRDEDIPPATWYDLHAVAAQNEDARRAGATVLWHDWWSEMRPRLMGRRAAVATFAVKTEAWGWGYRVVAGLNDELDWLEKKFAKARLLDEQRKRRMRAENTRRRKLARARGRAMGA